MVDMSSETKIAQTEFAQTELTQTGFTQALVDLLKEHNGQNVSMLDLRAQRIWTDFFIIATVTSNTHMDGLDRHIKEFCRAGDIEIFGYSRKHDDESWRLIDLGFVVIHLMTSSAREFYELERLWTIRPE